MHKLTECTYKQLEVVCDIKRLLTDLGRGQGKAEATKKAKVVEKKTEFTLGQMTVSKSVLTDAEQYALRVLSFDSNQKKACETWGEFSWTVPESMVKLVRTVWGKVKPGEKKPDNKAKPAESVKA